MGGFFLAGRRYGAALHGEGFRIGIRNRIQQAITSLNATLLVRFTACIDAGAINTDAIGAVRRSAIQITRAGAEARIALANGFEVGEKGLALTIRLTPDVNTRPLQTLMKASTLRVALAGLRAFVISATSPSRAIAVGDAANAIAVVAHQEARAQHRVTARKLQATLALQTAVDAPIAIAGSFVARTD